VIRAAQLSDIPAIVSIATESVSRDPLPVRIDPEAMSETAEEAIKSNRHFMWVSEIDGEVVGAVCCWSDPSFWYERQQASVLLYYTRVPGEGVKLLRKMMEWVESRPVIKVCVMELEPDADPRLIKFMQRIGMKRISTNVSYVRGLHE